MRAVRATLACGVKIGRIEFKPDKIVIIPAVAIDEPEETPLEQWRGKRVRET